MYTQADDADAWQAKRMGGARQQSSMCSADTHSRLFCAQRRTRRWYATLSSIYSCAASGLAGLEGLGSVSSDWIDTKSEQMVLIGLHCSCNTFMHSVPSVYTFGWNTWRRRPGVRGANASSACTVGPHLAREPHARWLVRVGLCEGHAQHEDAALSRCSEEEGECLTASGGQQVTVSRPALHARPVGRAHLPRRVIRALEAQQSTQGACERTRVLTHNSEARRTSTVAAQTNRLSSLCGAALQPWGGQKVTTAVSASAVWALLHSDRSPPGALSSLPAGLTSISTPPTTTCHAGCAARVSRGQIKGLGSARRTPLSHAGKSKAVR